MIILMGIYIVVAIIYYEIDNICKEHVKTVQNMYSEL